MVSLESERPDSPQLEAERARVAELEERLAELAGSHTLPTARCYLARNARAGHAASMPREVTAAGTAEVPATASFRPVPTRED